MPTCETPSLLARNGTRHELDFVVSMCIDHRPMSRSFGSERIRCRTRHNVLHSRIPTRVIPLSSVHRSLGDRKLFPSSLHCSANFWRRRPATITFSSIHQTNFFHMSSYHPLFLAAHTITFFDHLNMYYRSYPAVSQHITLPSSPHPFFH